jgi:hypothetical protein
MSLLAAKPHLCINETILDLSRGNASLNGNNMSIQKDKLDELCKAAQPKYPGDRGTLERVLCPFSFGNSTKPFLDAKVWDIEDAHRLVGRDPFLR